MSVSVSASTSWNVGELNEKQASTYLLALTLTLLTQPSSNVWPEKFLSIGDQTSDKFQRSRSSPVAQAFVSGRRRRRSVGSRTSHVTSPRRRTHAHSRPCWALICTALMLRAAPARPTVSPASSVPDVYLANFPHSRCAHTRTAAGSIVAAQWSSFSPPYVSASVRLSADWFVRVRAAAR